MATLALQEVRQAGLAAAYAAASAGGDEFTTGDDVFLHVKNGGGASVNVTVDSKTTCNQGVDHDLVVAVPAGGERFIGPLTPSRFGNSNGTGSVSYSATASVSVALLRL